MNIALSNDELIPDAELATKWHTSRRTLARYDNYPDGLPYVILNGQKWRPVRLCKEWLARRIVHPNPRRKVA